MAMLLARQEMFNIAMLSTVTLCVGLGIAMIIPSFSLFLIDAHSFSPASVGGTFTALAVMAIAANHFTGLLSDRAWDKRKIIAFCAIFGVLAAVCLIYAVEWVFLVPVSLCILSLSAGAGSQVFAYSREYSEEALPEKYMSIVSSVVRACSALSWVCGPPIAFFVIHRLGFKYTYLLAGVFFFVGAVGSLLLTTVGNYQKANLTSLDRNVSVAAVSGLPGVVKACILTLTLVFSANQIYIISLPAYLSTVLHIEAHSAGYLMGLAALLEMPIMVLLGFIANKYSRASLVFLGIAFGWIFFAGVVFAGEFWQLIGLQVFNALLISSVSVCGMLLVQDLLPGRVGAASALYINATLAGSILGSIALALLPGENPYAWVMPLALFVLTIASGLSVAVYFTLSASNVVNARPL